MSYVNNELQKVDSRHCYAAENEHSPSALNHSYDEQDRLHEMLTQEFPPVNTKCSITPPSYFSDQQTRDLLGGSPEDVPDRSAVEQDLDELGIFENTNLDASNEQPDDNLRPSGEEFQKQPLEIADSEAQDVIDDDAVDHLSQYLAENPSSSPQAAVSVAHEMAQNDSDEQTVVSRKTRVSKGRQCKRMYEDESEVDPPRKRSLRTRSMRQKMPFAMDKLENTLVRKGLAKTESDLEGDMLEQMHATQEKTAKKPAGKSPKKKAKKARRPLAERGNPPSQTPAPSNSTETISTPRVITEEPDIESDVFKTMVRSRLKGFGKGYLAIALPSSKSTTTLFSALAQKWRSGLRGRKIHHCIISFPWLADLGEDEAIIMFDENDNEGYGCMLDRIREAPSWRETGKCKIDLLIYTDEE